MFERIVNLKTPFPISGNALAIGKAGITFSPKLSSSLKNYKRVDVFWDRETKRLGSERIAKFFPSRRWM